MVLARPDSAGVHALRPVFLHDFEKQPPLCLVSPLGLLQLGMGLLDWFVAEVFSSPATALPRGVLNLASSPEGFFICALTL